MRVAVSLGIIAVAIGLSGCNKQPEHVPSFNTGAMVRFVNLTGSDLTFKLGNTGDAPCKSWDRTTFTRCRPKATEIIAKRKDHPDEKFTVDLKPSNRYTIYGVERGGKIEYVTIDSDPKDAEASRVIFRAISFHSGDVDVAVKPLTGDLLEAKGLKSGAPSDNMVSTPQRFKVTVTSGGKKIGEEEVDTEEGGTYTIAVSGDGKAIKVFHNNPKMLASPGGSSPT